MKGEYMEKFVQDLQGAIQAKRNLCDSTVDEQKAGTPEGYILHGMEIALCMAKERLCENNQECGGEMKINPDRGYINNIARNGKGSDAQEAMDYITVELYKAISRYFGKMMYGRKDTFIPDLELANQAIAFERDNSSKMVGAFTRAFDEKCRIMGENHTLRKQIEEVRTQYDLALKRLSELEKINSQVVDLRNAAIRQEEMALRQFSRVMQERDEALMKIKENSDATLRYWTTPDGSITIDLSKITNQSYTGVWCAQFGTGIVVDFIEQSHNGIDNTEERDSFVSALKAYRESL